MDMANQLARDLGVSIEFVPFSEDIIEPLRGDHFDVAMSGLEGTVKRARELPDMEAYMEVTRAVVVPDNRRRQFDSLSRLEKELRNREKLRVAIVAGSIQSESTGIDAGLGTGAAALKSRGLFDDVQIVTLSNASEFFKSQPPVADILITSAEEGSAWTLKYPRVLGRKTGRLGRPLATLLLRPGRIAVRRVHEQLAETKKARWNGAAII